MNVCHRERHHISDDVIRIQQVLKIDNWSPAKLAKMLPSHVTIALDLRLIALYLHKLVTE